MIEYIQNHQPGFWIMTGFILLAVEVMVLGFATIVLLFAGLGALFTGFFMQVGVLPQTWLAGIASFGICTGISTALLWRPLKKIQQKSVPQSGQSSDLIGYSFVLEQDISTSQPGETKYSGITWRVEVADDAGTEAISRGQRVTVTSLDAGVFRVKVLS